MRLSAGMTREEIRSALGQMALQSWGPGRLEALAPALDTTAGAIWQVLQVPLSPLEEEPDLAASPCPPSPEV